jgi:hypothetical protein
MRRTLPRSLAGGLLMLVLAGSITMTAGAVPPKQQGNPTLQPGGTPYVGDTISITNGIWTGNPTKYTFRWERCDPVGDRRNCVSIPGATSQSYTVVKADVNHKLHGVVTASNADGSATADATSPVVLDTVPPANTARPVITGTPTVGATLTATNGTWRGAASFTYSWQQCDANGNACAAISGATGKTYGVRSSDVDRRLRVEVTARNKYGSNKALSDITPLVTANTQTTTTVVTVPGNKAPTINFLSLKRVGTKIYARFRVCDDSYGRVRVTERDNKARALPYARTFTVTPSTCGTYARNWKLIPRFRSPGKLVVTLRARDSDGSLSRLVSRSIRIR